MCTYVYVCKQPGHSLLAAAGRQQRREEEGGRGREKEGGDGGGSGAFIRPLSGCRKSNARWESS